MRYLIFALLLIATPAPAQQMAPKVNTAEAPQRVIDCSAPGPCSVTYPYGVVACDNAGTCGFHENVVAGCDRGDPEFMWCLRNNSGSEMTLLPDGKAQFTPNEAMRAYVIESDRRLPHGCWGSWDDPKCP